MTNHVWFQNGAPRWRFQPLISADGSSEDSCEDGKIPWILAQLFLEFMKHTNIYQYSLRETHQEAFCSVNKQLCSSYLPLLRLSDSACWFLMGYRFISVWNACVLYPSESSVENNSYMICAHFLQLNRQQRKAADVAPVRQCLQLLQPFGRRPLLRNRARLSET